MLLECLVLLHDIQVYFLEYWECTKHSLRDWLGPGERKWYLTSDNQITHIPVSDSLVFYSIRNRIHSINQVHSEKKGKHLPWLAICIKSGEDSWDISDWISEIRILPDSPQPTLLQITRLASRIHHIYVYETDATKLYVTNREGEDEVYDFQGTVVLEKQK